MALSKERKELLDKLVAERKPVSLIQREHGFNYATIRKYYPDYRTEATANWEDHYANIPRDVREQVEGLIKDHAPFTIIEEVTGVSVEKLDKLYPGKAWSKTEAGRHGGIVSTYYSALYGPLAETD